MIAIYCCALVNSDHFVVDGEEEEGEGENEQGEGEGEKKKRKRKKKKKGPYLLYLD